MTANDPFNTAAPSGLPAVVTPKDIPEKITLANCQKQMEQANDAARELLRDGLTIAIEMGHAAGAAREVLAPSKGFIAWIEKTFPQGTKHYISVQWARKCIKAAEVDLYLADKRPKQADAIKAKFCNIEKFGALMNDLVAGVDVLSDDYAKLAPMGRPKKLTIDRSTSAKLDPEDEDEAGDDSTPVPPKAAAALDKRAADLDRREKVLDAKERRLQEWEDDLTRRAALMKSQPVVDVTARDVSRETSDPIADAKAKAIAHSAKLQSERDAKAGKLATRPESVLKPEAAPKAKPQRARAPGKAALMPASAPTTGDQDPAGATPAPTPEIAPETADALKDAAQRVVGAVDADGEGFAVVASKPTGAGDGVEVY